MYSIKTKQPEQLSPAIPGASQSAWASRVPERAPIQRPAPATDYAAEVQFKVRLENLICDARKVLDDLYARQWASYSHPEKIVERLNTQLKRGVLLRSLLELGMPASELHQLEREEIDFVRGAELFLDQLGAQQLREREDSRRTELI